MRLAGSLGPRFAAAEARSEVRVLVVRACSACAGDYEDPDVTAWPADEFADDEFSAAEFAIDDARDEALADEIDLDGGDEA